RNHGDRSTGEGLPAQYETGIIELSVKYCSGRRKGTTHAGTVKRKTHMIHGNRSSAACSRINLRKKESNRSRLIVDFRVQEEAVDVVICTIAGRRNIHLNGIIHR